MIYLGYPPFEEDIDVKRLACNIYDLSLDEYEYIKENLSQNRALIEDHYEDMGREEIPKKYFDVLSFIYGYQAAQSKQYSLEDIEQILFDYDNVDWSKREHKQPTIIMKEWLKEKIQSLPNQQFSLEDLIAFGKKCFYKGFDKSENDDSNCYTAWREENSGLVQTLSTQQLPKKFIPEYDVVYFHGSGYYTESQLSLKERETHSFMKEQRLKTITNSEGKEELVGVWKFDK